MIPISEGEKLLKDPHNLAPLMMAQYGGEQSYTSTGDKFISVKPKNHTIPPPNVMRLSALQRNRERQKQEDEEEADEFEKQMSMQVKQGEDATKWNFTPSERRPEAEEQRRRLLQTRLDASLGDTAYQYEVRGCGLAECNGVFEYQSTTCHGAPVYANKKGWHFHRHRCPVEHTIGTDDEQTEFGWVVSKNGSPFYAVRTDAMVAPPEGWEHWSGPPPAPAYVTCTGWVKHIVEVCGPLKEAGNELIKTGKNDQAEARYTAALSRLHGYTHLTDSSEDLRDLLIALFANRAEARLRQQNWNGVVEDCQEVQKLDPQHEKANVRYAKALKGMGRWEEAVPILQTCRSDNHQAQSLLAELRALAGCAKGDSRLSNLYAEICSIRDKLQGEILGQGEAVRQAGKRLAGSLRRIQGGFSDDSDLLHEAKALLSSSSLVDLLLGALANGDAKADWGFDLLGECIWPQMTQAELRFVLDQIPSVIPKLVENPDEALKLVKRLLCHPQARGAHAADLLVESAGFLRCLRPWCRHLEDGTGTNPNQEEAADIIQSLDAQAIRPENRAVLAQALFIELLIGDNPPNPGGVLLYLSPSARQVSLALLRSWTADKIKLQALKPTYVGRTWRTLAAKLRRDAGVEAERLLPSKNVVMQRKLEWFELKKTEDMMKRTGTFMPEEATETVLLFMEAHLEATLAKGPEKAPPKGIAPRDQGEAWIDDAIDRPFGWGVLLPLVQSVPQIASKALALLEAVVKANPNNAKIAEKLGGLHVFFPLLAMPWPTSAPATSSLGETLQSGSLVRRAFCTVLRTVIDSDACLNILDDHKDRTVQAMANLLEACLPDQNPSTTSEVFEAYGIALVQLDITAKIPSRSVDVSVDELMRSTDKISRASCCKFLRLVWADPLGHALMQKSFQREKLGLEEHQINRLLDEIWSVGTVAGQEMHELVRGEQQEKLATPIATSEAAKEQKHVNALAKAIFDAYLVERPEPRIFVIGRMARCFSLAFGKVLRTGSVICAETTLAGIDEEPLIAPVETVLLPKPQAMQKDEKINGCRGLFDLAIAADPIGYLDICEYADHLRPLIRRREKEEEKMKDQVQLVIVEQSQRVEDAEEELFAAGYYRAEKDAVFQGLTRLAKKWNHDVVLCSLPSAEKERRKVRDQEKARERKKKREEEERVLEEKNIQDDQRTCVLSETLFDPVLSPPEPVALPAAFEVGCPPDEADHVLFWLSGNGEDPAVYQSVMEDVVQKAGPGLRIICAGHPEGSQRKWFSWSDLEAVQHGAVWFDIFDDPSEEGQRIVRENPTSENITFGRSSLEELQVLEEMEVGCKQLANLVEEELQATRPGARAVIGGFSQGGSIAMYTALGGGLPEEVSANVCAVVPCLSGIPVLHFVGKKMQDQYKSRGQEYWDEGKNNQPVKVHMVYGDEKDQDIPDDFVKTTRDLITRFAFPVTVNRIQSTQEARFPEETQAPVLSKIMKSIMRS